MSDSETVGEIREGDRVATHAVLRLLWRYILLAVLFVCQPSCGGNGDSGGAEAIPKEDESSSPETGEGADQSQGTSVGTEAGNQQLFFNPVEQPLLAPDKGLVMFTVVVPRVAALNTLRISKAKLEIAFTRNNIKADITIFEGDIEVTFGNESDKRVLSVQSGTILPGVIDRVSLTATSVSASWPASDSGPLRTQNLLIAKEGRYVFEPQANLAVVAGHGTVLEIQVGVHCPKLVPADSREPAAFVAAIAYRTKEVKTPRPEAEEQRQELKPTKPSGEPQSTPTSPNLDPTETSRKACGFLLAPDHAPPRCSIDLPGPAVKNSRDVWVSFHCVDALPSYGLDRSSLTAQLDGSAVEFPLEWDVWATKKDMGGEVPLAVSTGKTFSLLDGTHELSLSVKDRVGNVSDESRITFYIDTKGPTIRDGCSMTDALTGKRMLIKAKIESPVGINQVVVEANNKSWGLQLNPPDQYRVIIPIEDVIGLMRLIAVSKSGNKAEELFRQRDSIGSEGGALWGLGKGIVLVIPAGAIESPKFVGIDTYCLDKTETEVGFRIQDTPLGPFFEPGGAFDPSGH